ncbi:MAG: stage V sporulation protein AC [Clostridia bacterium]|nr:stage V sporulation protein AC [Clostridia bacterium]
MKKSEYKKYVQKHAEKSDILRDCIRAFVCGGAICIFAQLLHDSYSLLGATDKTSSSLVSVTLIFLAVLLTGTGKFDKAARFAGAGLLVPITGFANSVVAPAIDTKAEGQITGVGTKIFSVAGPVILYGTLASVIWGLIYYLTTLI